MIDGYIGFPTFGLFGLLIAFAGTAISVLALLLAHCLRRRSASLAETFATVGYVATLLGCLALTFCCAVLVYCFMVGDISITYVVEYQSDATGSLAWLYRLSGLWAGREGSLLFWAWLISVFNAVVAVRHMGRMEELDNAALLVAQLVLAAFVGVLLFSEDNIPFVTIDDAYIDEDGALTGSATLWGMSSLLEHWAMAIHPPTLFIGYAGLTIPFAYAIATLMVGDASKLWVQRASGYAVFSWLFLTIGIGLGAIWAYVVLGWGGYWGWDPVENASLLPWLTSVVLLHSLTVYRQRGIFKRWSVFAACLSFSFVIFGTFITRSGLIESVHAFSGDAVSLVLFLALIVCSLLAGIVGLIVRWKAFASPESEQMDSLPGKYVAYYVNNLVMVLCAVLLGYMTIASALPSPLPLAGMSVSTATYEAIARPLGVIYFALAAICPLLSWAGKGKRAQGVQLAAEGAEGQAAVGAGGEAAEGMAAEELPEAQPDPAAEQPASPGARSLKGARTRKKHRTPATFGRLILVPGICALVLFAVLVAVFVLYLKPMYDSVIAAGGSGAEELLAYGPSWYYFALTIAGFAVASLLLFNSLFTAARALRGGLRGLRARLPRIGGALAHAGMAVMLVGLIGSSMYVTDETFYLTYDEDSDSMDSDIVLYDYTLTYSENAAMLLDNEDDVLYQICFDVYKGGRLVKHVSPSLTYTMSTVSTTTNAVVVSQPYEDLFVVFQGTSEDGEVCMEVRVNPLISFVWAGVVLLALGMLVALCGARGPRRRKVAPEELADAEERAAGAEERALDAEQRAALAEQRAREAEARAAALAAQAAGGPEPGGPQAPGVPGDADAPEAAEPGGPGVCGAPEGAACEPETSSVPEDAGASEAPGAPAPEAGGAPEPDGPATPQS